MRSTNETFSTTYWQCSIVLLQSDIISLARDFSSSSINSMYFEKSPHSITAARIWWILVHLLWNFPFMNPASDPQPRRLLQRGGIQHPNQPGRCPLLQNRSAQDGSIMSPSKVGACTTFKCFLHQSFCCSTASHRENANIVNWVNREVVVPSSKNRSPGTKGTALHE